MATARSMDKRLSYFLASPNFFFFFARNLDENMSCVKIDKLLSNILFSLPL